jgi:heme A synthase
MVALHIAVGAALILLNLLAFAVGGFAWFRDRPSIPFWYLLRAAQVAVFLQAVLGGLLVFFGHEQDDDLHYLYGILPLFVSFIAEGARTGAADRELRDIDVEAMAPDQQERVALAIVRREMGIMAVSCGVIFFLGLRAAGTSGLF